MVELEVEQKTAEMWVLPHIGVAEESRRQWTSLSRERRRMLTTPVETKRTGD